MVEIGVEAGHGVAVVVQVARVGLVGAHGDDAGIAVLTSVTASS